MDIWFFVATESVEEINEDQPHEKNQRLLIQCFLEEWGPISCALADTQAAEW